MNPEELYSLRSALYSHFAFEEPERLVHPVDILKMSNHPKHLTRDTRDINVKKSFWDRLFPLHTLGARLVRKAKRAIDPPPSDTWTVYGVTVRRKEETTDSEYAVA